MIIAQFLASFWVILEPAWGHVEPQNGGHFGGATGPTNRRHFLKAQGLLQSHLRSPERPQRLPKGLLKKRKGFPQVFHYIWAKCCKTSGNPKNPIKIQKNPIIPKEIQKIQYFPGFPVLEPRIVYFLKILDFLDFLSNNQIFLDFFGFPQVFHYIWAKCCKT